MAALGRLGGVRGGKARARNLSKERLSEIGKMGAAARWGGSYGVSISKRLVSTGKKRMMRTGLTGDHSMPIKYFPDGTIVFDTPAEAAEYERLRQGASRTITVTARGPGPSVAATGTPIASANHTVHGFLVKLKQLDGKTANAEHLADLLSTKTTGVGPKLRGIRNAFAKEGGSLDAILQPMKNSDGTVSWKVRFPPSRKSA